MTGSADSVLVLDSTTRCSCPLPEIATPEDTATCACGHAWKAAALPGDALMWARAEPVRPVPPCRVRDSEPPAACPQPAAYMMVHGITGERSEVCVRHALRFAPLFSFREGGTPPHKFIPFPGEAIIGDMVHVSASDEPGCDWGHFAQTVESICLSWSAGTPGRWFTGPRDPRRGLCLAFVPRPGSREAVRSRLAVAAAECAHPGVVWAESATDVLRADPAAMDPPPAEDDVQAPAPAEEDSTLAAAGDDPGEPAADTAEDAVPGCD